MASRDTSVTLDHGAVDMHVHVFVPDRFPYHPERSYTPPPADLDGLADNATRLGVTRQVLVQPSVYGSDNRALVDALRQLGDDRARGVVVVGTDVDHDELRAQRDIGVRGIRMNMRSSAKSALEHRDMRAEFQRIHGIAREHRLAVQLFVDDRDLSALHDLVAAADVPVILDHFGGLAVDSAHEVRGRENLLALDPGGHVWLKLSGLYRIVTPGSDSPTLESNGARSRGPTLDALGEVLSDLIGRGWAERMIWASDWPHTGGGQDREDRSPSDIEPFRTVDIAHHMNVLQDWVGDADTWHRIAHVNPLRLFWE